MTASSLARKAAKAAVLPLGLPARRRPGDVLILLYHRVGAGRREVDLSVEAFDRQMAALADSDPPLSLDDAIGNRDGAGGVVVTFDDGLGDFADHALPVLVRHGVPALLYLQTGLVREELPAGVANGEHLSWSQLAEAAASGLVSIGAHTHSHPDLSRTSEAEAEVEMRRSKELIEDRLGTSCRHFAYPFAIASPGAERAARRLFDSAAVGAWRTNRLGRLDPYRLGRTPVLRSDGPLMFRAKVRGWLDGEAMFYRALGRGPWRRS